ncbi:nitrate- and nitrite sensing domain-containing protein [Streptomyces sp. FXJ1.172]|uniref:sensor histidine kinase n=1 Tax=Streptomyces sp. FXJ1.172 TaxID=710705 RepID=UPI0007CFB061|nr:nitrate- and nitrite sensing domain-containing protein [Streptomyces sp. FXJ1.172]WEO98657.1 nitrate- and nitrite sensing domain-containing protein [Streptomyces sp. FXJ1.172]
MRFRGKSIRRKIVALLLVPLVSLTAIWGFATVLTGREVAQLFHANDITKGIGYPTEDTVRAIQQERRQTLVYLADPRAADALSALEHTRTVTDRAIAKIRKDAKDHDVVNGMDAADGERLTSVLDALDGVDSLRRSVEQGTVDRAQALDLYNHLVDPCYTLLDALDGVDDVELDKQARALVNVTRARELLSREDALLGSSLVVGRLTREETQDISDLVAQRNLLYDISLPLLPAGERDRYERFWRDASTAPLRTAEQSVIGAESGTPRDVTAKSWDTAAAGVLDDLGTLDDQTGDRFQDRTRPVAMTVILQAAIAGLLGLVALLLSLVLSVRVGRSLIRDLRQLRLEAHEASGVRLPSVMRRLSAGEQVDVETEAPRLEYDKNEVGEVGQALNTLQRAAVEAAVKQAELRAGVSEVFVNLARRSQVLLHKQLTLLDTMERRTEDTDELADLFRLDHLTTRMRRHAEGLVILSGAAPSRQWRRPVQLMDVVRAAVAEVEDYERIEVRRLPRVAVTGPAVADLTHLVAELLENATVFSPPHTAVQVLGERVANGFTLEIHDRGLGMTAEALLDANLRLAETPEFELSDTDRLGLFVVSRLAQRQNVRVSLQPSPYGGTTAVVFLPDALLTDDVPDTNGLGFRLDRDRPAKETGQAAGRVVGRSPAPVQLPGLPTSLLDGPVELEAPVDLDALEDFPGALADEDSERGGLFRPRRSLAHDDERTASQSSDRPPRDTAGDRGPVPLPRRQPPKLVSSHGKPVTDQRSRRDEPGEQSSAEPRRSEPGVLAPLPSRRRGAAAPRPGDLTDRAEEGAPSPATGAADPAEAPPLPRRARRAAPTTDGPDAPGGSGLTAGRGSGAALPPGDADRSTSDAPRPAGDAAAPTGGPAWRTGDAASPTSNTAWPGEYADSPTTDRHADSPTTDRHADSPTTDRSRADGALPSVGGVSRPGDSGGPAADAAGSGYAARPVAGSGDAFRPPADVARSGDAIPPAGDGIRSGDAPLRPAPRASSASGATDPSRAGAAAPDGTADFTTGDAAARPAVAPGGTGPLPRRVRQASLAPQLKQDTARRAERAGQPADRDAEEVRSRMASLQRGWQRGREENAAGDGSRDGTAPGTTEGDGR